jgi:hypothetical protein
MWGRAIAGATGLALIWGAGPAAAEAPVVIETLSNRADLVAGDDVLVGVRLPDGADAAGLRVTLDGRDLTGVFASRASGGIAGLVEGLRLGPNVLTAQAPGAAAPRLTVVGHPTGGPVFSGPQVGPWYCLDGALDAQCNRPTTFTYTYKNSAGQFGAYDPANPPGDVATVTTDQGKTVPYVVRVETGNMDRSQYRIAVLADGDKPFDRWAGPPAWNHKVYVPHGSGCGQGHSEGAAPDVMLDGALAKGFAVMSTALEHNTENCNVVVQAESVMMAKEHLIERYGDVRYMIGTGCSGGSIAQLWMANAYPGLYDGLTVSCTYPDDPVNDLLDCPAAMSYFNAPASWAPGVVWGERERAAALGLASSSVCIAWQAAGYSNMFDPRAGVECDVPAREPEKVYEPQTNPGGVRCTIQDYMVNVFGSRPAGRWGAVEKQIGRGFAGRPYDNVGVQYGLRALMSRSITPAAFADLNAKIGSRDLDFGQSPARAEADPDAIVRAYRSGFSNEANHLDRVPIIDIPGTVPGDRYEFHDNYKSWGLRSRLEAAHGTSANHVIWYGPESLRMDTLTAMDEWLAAVEKDRRNVPLARKVIEDRPESVRDTCEVPNRTGCDAVFGPAGNMRWGAGMQTLANDVIKCRLKPLRRNDYAPVMVSDAEWETLKQAFPTGVCDWSEPGVEQQGAVAWQTYQNADGTVIPGGRALPPAPVPLSASRVSGGEVVTGALAARVTIGRPGRRGLPVRVRCTAVCRVSAQVRTTKRRRVGSVSRTLPASRATTLRVSLRGSKLRRLVVTVTIADTQGRVVRTVRRRVLAPA